jgi:cytoskeletal protein CcmA (bactofilin family)
MFGDKKINKNTVNVDSFAANTIQSGTSIKGEVISEGSIRIDGKLVGSLSTRGKLVVGSSGMITGDVVCENANIEGKIEGKLEVGAMLILKQSAIIEGDICTLKLVVEEGAVFSGNISMGQKLQKSVLKNEESEFQKQAV